MKTIAGLRMLVVAAAVAAVGAARAADAVQPAMVTVTNWRSDTISAVSAVTYYEGATLRFTNCVVYATGSDTNGTIQGLEDVDVDLTIGTTSTSHVYQATVDDVDDGTWSANITVPSWTGQLYMQLKLTDAVSTNSFIYPWKTISKQAPL
jgi:hypothetical protein